MWPLGNECPMPGAFSSEVLDFENPLDSKSSMEKSQKKFDIELA
jgi:hypothetical protein